MMILFQAMYILAQQFILPLLIIHALPNMVLRCIRAQQYMLGRPYIMLLMINILTSVALIFF